MSPFGRRQDSAHAPSKRHVIIREHLLDRSCLTWPSPRRFFRARRRWGGLFQSCRFLRDNERFSTIKFGQYIYGMPKEEGSKARSGTQPDRQAA